MIGLALAMLLAGEVKIAYFGPSGDTFWEGATLAIEHANRDGGYRGRPFRLVQAWSENPWQAGTTQLVRLAYDDRVSVVIGSVDAAATHLAAQVAAKALFPLIDPGSTSRDVNGAKVPWVFSCLPSDKAIAAAMGRVVAEEDPNSFAILSTVDHDSRTLTREVEAWLRRERLTPVLALQVSNVAPDLPESVRAVLVIAPPRESAAIVRSLPRRTKVIGGPAMARRTFIDLAGKAADGVRAPLLASANATATDYGVAQAYDAVSLAVAAIRRAGLDRELIRDAIRDLSPWSGKAGEIRWDAVGRNLRTVEMGFVVNGQLLP
jgi:ABC-type branched-subunit amino acid transport system substrate-binding protein